MSIKTYAGLQKALVQWAGQNESLSVLFPNFITLVETEIRANRDESLKLFEGQEVSTSTLPKDSRVLAFPTGFYKISRMNIEVNEEQLPVTFRTNNQLSIASGTGTPLYYTIANGEIEFNVKADQDYPITLYYHATFTPLTTTNTANIVLENYPNIYLFGCLKQAYISINDDEQAVKYDSLFIQAIKDANRAEKEKTLGDTLQMTGRW